MKNFFFIILFAYPFFILPSSTSLPNDAFSLMKIFHRHLNNPNHITFSDFKVHARGCYSRFPDACVRLLERHRGNWVFVVVFSSALTGNGDFVNPTTITPDKYSILLRWIYQEIRQIFINCCGSDESNFKSNMETISLMIKLAEKTSSDLSSQGINDKFISGFSDLAIIWKYLIENISLDFTNKTINYYSLFRTLNEIGFMVNRNSLSIVPNLRLTKRFALLWVYLRHIRVNSCNVIFQAHHPHNILVICIILEFWSGHIEYNDDEFYPKRLGLIIENILKNGAPQFDFISEILGNQDPKWESYSLSCILDVPKKISSFIELTRFLSKNSFQYGYPITTWRINALAELEVYLSRYNLKINYSNDPH